MKRYQNILQNEVEIFNSLAHPARLEILDLLRDGEACVCHIQAMLDQRQAYVSQHLNVLRQAGLVTSRKDGLRVYYQVSDPILFEVIDRIKVFLQEAGAWQTDEASPSHAKKPCNCPQCSEKQVERELSEVTV